MSGRDKKRRKTTKFLTGVLIIDVIAIIVIFFVFVKFIKPANKDKASGKGDVTATEYVSETLSETESADLSTDMQDSNDSSEEETTESPVYDDPAAAYAEDMLSKMSLHEKVCQMFIITPEAATGYFAVTEAGEASKQALVDYPVCGYIYFAQNLQSVEQTKTMLSNVKQYGMDANGIPFFTSVDEEGGIVARCADKLGTTSFNSMYYYRTEGTETAYNNAYTIASDISGLGFNLDFAPVADTWSNSANTVIGERAYSTDYQEAALLVASATKGFNDGGVVSCIKHFPGHGDTVEDSHKSAAYIHKSLAELDNEDYLPFKAGIEAGTGMVMVGHLYLTDADIISSDDDYPASLNYKVITGELRQKLGYDGVVITDSLAMGAISNYYSSGDAVKLSVKAGADIMLMPADFKSAVSALEDAVESGEISEERINASVRRILILKYNTLIKD
ncbi:MAG: glycoside hydrolase family 3 protein [Lachnospiraceae bacterium]|nr:glycoside hydrolase family 3 protein [Lachnospiraceae bacterium]